jgi:hypothetical protein|tara:strand:- start:44309 stop:44434 length:126 start_codon:yes stop_codon:yes gene_type:complete
MFSQKLLARKGLAVLFRPPDRYIADYIAMHKSIFWAQKHKA